MKLSQSGRLFFIVDGSLRCKVWGERRNGEVKV